MVVRVFVAGGTSVLGRRLVPQLLALGHQVTATTTSAAKLGLLAQLGAEGVVMDGLDARGRGGGRGRAGRDRASDNGPLRGARRQTAGRLGRAARARAEAAVPPGRGWHASATKPKPSQSAVPSGPGWHRLRLVGVHVDDAASAAVLAKEQNAKGCSTSSTTSRPPSASGFRSSRSAPGPGRRDEFPAWLARLLAGEMAVGMVTEGRGFSNANSKRELGWELRYPSWRQGFKEELA
jgi:nucleoside-diphosphate-sugar epimerase